MFVFLMYVVACMFVSYRLICGHNQTFLIEAYTIKSIAYFTRVFLNPLIVTICFGAALGAIVYGGGDICWTVAQISLGTLTLIEMIAIHKRAKALLSKS